MESYVYDMCSSDDKIKLDVLGLVACFQEYIKFPKSRNIILDKWLICMNY